MRFRRFGLVCGMTALICVLPVLAAEARVVRAWTEYAAAGLPEARVITDGTACPAAVIDGAGQPMAERHSPDERFPVRVCAVTVPSDARTVAVEGVALPAPARQASRIIVMGDTGCRLKGAIVQDCNDPAAWPFANVAAMAAAEKPDLVIHIGDIIYRETACAKDDRRCAGSPWGDNWLTWDADFFAPAEPLLKAAPWVVVRGNHEDCHRAGIGWTATLAPDRPVQACSPHDVPRIVDLGGFRMALVDDNDAEAKAAAPEIVSRLAEDLRVVLAQNPDWLLVHHPVRGVSKLDGGGKNTAGANATLMAALQGLDDHRLQMILSGHIHNFEIANYQGKHPPQLVAGIGGDLLDHDAPASLRGLTSGDARIRSGLSLAEFGYLVMERHASTWTITVHLVDGRKSRSCRLRNRRLACD